MGQNDTGESDLMQVSARKIANEYSCFFFKVTFDDWDGAGNDYGLGGGNNAKQLTLRGKDNVAEKVRVWQGPGLFSKDFKVVEVWRIDSKIF